MTDTRTDYSWLNTVSIMVLATVAGAVALLYTRPVMVPFVLAIFISYLASPLVDFLCARVKMPKSLAVLLTLLVAAALITLVVLLIITSTRGLLENVDLYRTRVVSLAERTFDLLDSRGIDLGQGELLQGLRDFNVLGLPILRFLGSTASGVASILINGVLVLIFLIYLLIGRNPNQFRTGFYAEIDTKVRSYIVIKFITSATTGVLTWIILSLFGLDLALVFGVMAFLLNFIPSIGSAIAVLLPLPVALVQFDSGLAIVMIVVLPAAVQFSVGNVIEPLVMGEGLDLHPVVILMALVFWGLLWGVVGMLLAAPMTAVLRIVLGRLELTRPVAELLAGRLPPNLPTGQYPVP